MWIAVTTQFGPFLEQLSEQDDSSTEPEEVQGFRILKNTEWSHFLSFITCGNLNKLTLHHKMK